MELFTFILDLKTGYNSDLLLTQSQGCLVTQELNSWGSSQLGYQGSKWKTLKLYYPSVPELGSPILSMKTLFRNINLFLSAMTLFNSQLHSHLSKYLKVSYPYLDNQLESSSLILLTMSLTIHLFHLCILLENYWLITRISSYLKQIKRHIL